MCSTTCLKTNGQLAVKLIEMAIERNIKILFFPEAADYLSRDASHSKSICQTLEDSEFLNPIRSKLADLNSKGIELFVNVGVHEPCAPEEKDERIKNVSIWINNKGEIEQKYTKLHLYDVNLPNNKVRESDSIKPGTEVLSPFATPAGRLGLGICYDLRFPELSLKLRSLGAEILSFPSAFMMRTGAAHWETLGKSRAIDSQCYVVMSAQSGKHPETTRESYGHSMIIDPWGTVIAKCSDIKPGNLEICSADIDLDLLQKVRETLPLESQRRRDVF